MILNLEVSSGSTTIYKSCEMNKPFDKINQVGFIIAYTWV